jgi:Protein of unknown function (DUF3551)
VLVFGRDIPTWRNIMQRLPFVLAIALAAIAQQAQTAAAQDPRAYPWCAEYSDDVGAMSCGYASMQQCLAEVSGIGGFCIENPGYRPPAVATAPRRTKARRS